MVLYIATSACQDNPGVCNTGARTSTQGTRILAHEFKEEVTQEQAAKPNKIL